MGEGLIVRRGGAGKAEGMYVWKRSELVPLNGYTELEYLTTDGTQYVNTGVFPTFETSLEMKLQTTQQASACLASGCVAWGRNGFGIFANGVMYGNQTKDASVATFYGSSPVVALLDRNKLYKNGNLQWTANEEVFTAPVQMVLFGMNANGSVSEKTAMKMWYTKLLERGIVVRRYKPCKDSAGVVGLYDLTGDKLYTKAIGNAFGAGTAIGTLKRHVFKDYVVSSDPNAYPHDGELDGFFYEFIKIDNLADAVSLTEEYFRAIEAAALASITGEVNNG